MVMKKLIDLSAVQTLVLDEADRNGLDMWLASSIFKDTADAFFPPPFYKRQTLFFPPL